MSSISPSIDIQVSSNFERLLLEIEGNDTSVVRDCMAQMDASGQFRISENALRRIRTQFEGRGVSEEETLRCMAETMARSNMVIDPHTAVGVGAVEKLQAAGRLPRTTVTMATAHPAKFPDPVEKATGVRPPLPAHLADLFDREERFTRLPNDLAAVQEFVATTFR